MAEVDEDSRLKEQGEEIQEMKRSLDMLDQRLDNIDSIVTAVAERVMNQLVALSVTCSHCGKDTEIAIIGSHRLKQ